MQINSSPFNYLFLNLYCPSCEEDLIIGLNEKIHNSGFICPFCSKQIKSSEIWNIYINLKINEKFKA